MKNSKGETLPQPYLALAEMRRAQQNGSSFLKTWEHEFETAQTIDYAFEWHSTTENNDWWTKVYEGQLPALYHESLEELEAWEKERITPKPYPIDYAPISEAAQPDYKAMYEDVKGSYEILDKALHYALEKMQDQTSRNWIAECAMAAMQGYLSNPSESDAGAKWVLQTLGLPENTKYDWLVHHPQFIAKLSFDYAEAWAAEGKKRGHI